MSSINILPKTTVRLITTSQIITSVSTAVKELMENSIDANASSIQISLINQGLDMIELKDDGSGIPQNDVHLICRPSCTSKISDIADLDSLSSYGFRGEALNALCQIGEVSITTRTANDNFATMYIFNKDGNIVSSQPSHFPKGTTITIKNLFKNMPVRKQYLSSKSRASEELKKVERIVKSLSLIHWKLRVTLSHNKCAIWMKNNVSSIRLAMSQIVPLNVVNQLEELNYISKVNNANILLILPKKTVSDISALCMSNIQQAYFIYINKRPVRNNKIEKMLSKEFSDSFRSLIPHNKYPVCLVSIEIPGDSVDVNLEPNKTKVFIKDVDDLTDCMKEKIFDYYYDVKQTNTENKVPKYEDQAIAGKRKCVDEGCTNEKKVKICITNESSELNGMMNESTTDTTISVNGVMETTLSQLPLIIESGNSDDSLGNIEVVENKENCFNIEKSSEMKSIWNETSNNQKFYTYNTGDIISLNETISCSSNSQESVQSTKPKGKNNQDFEIHEIDETKNDISLTQWSKGNVKINNKLLEEPTRVFNSNEIHRKSKLDDSKQSMEVYISNEESIRIGNGSTIMNNSIEENDKYFQTQSDHLIETLNTSEDFSRSVTSQMGCKQYNNFTNFAREVRKEIIENQPGISFTKVASELVNKWNDLHDDEKKAYKNTASTDKLKTKAVDTTNRSMLEFVNKKISKRYREEIKININVNEIKLKIEEKLGQKNDSGSESGESVVDDIEEKTFDDTEKLYDTKSSDPEIVQTNRRNYLLDRLVKLKEEFKNIEDSAKRKQFDMGNKYIQNMQLRKIKFRVIGEHNKNWYYRYRRSIGMIDTDHLYTIVTYHKYLKTYQLPIVDLDSGNCIRLDDNLVDKIMSLDLVVHTKETDRSVNTLHTVGEEFLLNGIGLRISHSDESSVCSIEICKKPKDIIDLQADDIEELYNLVKLKLPMEHCRPKKIQRLIRDIAQRHCEENSLEKSKEKLMEMVSYWFEHIKHFKSHFIYKRNIFHKIGELPCHQQPDDV